MGKLQSFLDTLGLDEEPMGMFYTDEKPLEGFSPNVSDLPTREKEIKKAVVGMGSIGKKIFQH